MRVFRIKVVKSFLKAGVPLAKVDCFREVFEESAFRLSHSSNLSQLILLFVNRSLLVSEKT